MIRRSFLKWVQGWMRDAGFRTRGQTRRNRRPGWAPQMVQLEARALLSAGAVADQFEGDNTPATAAVISTYGVPQVHSFHQTDDVDWMTFTLDMPSQVQIQTSGDLGGDTLLHLYGPNNASNLIDANDDGGFDMYSQILRRGPSALPAGTYHVRVSNADPDNTLDQYSVSVLATDIYETDKVAAQATAIDTNGAAQIHSLHSRTDTDWVKFTLNQSSLVTIETNGVAGGDTTLDLFASDGRTLIESDNDDGVDAYSRIDRTTDNPLAAGTYYVRVRENGQDATVARYGISVRATDVYEQDDTAADAKNISVFGIPQTHSLHVGTDVDWVKFTLSQPSFVTITTAGDAGGDTALDLYGPNSTTNLIQSNDNFGTTTKYSQIVRTGTSQLAAGTYYVRVRAADGARLPSYTINVQAWDVFENDNAWILAKVLPIDGSLQTHSLSAVTDADWVRFTLPVTSTVVLRTDGDAGGDTMLELYASNGTTRIASADGGGTGLYSRLTRHLAAGTYFAKVTENGQNSTIDRYTLRLTTDDFEDDNDSTRPRLIETNGVPQARSLNVPGDADWATFTLNQTSIVTIETDGDAGGDTVLDLYGPNSAGTLIESNDNNGVNGYSRIERSRANPLPAGTYFIRVIENGQNSAIDRYTLKVNAVDVWEDDNDASRANVVPTNGTAQTHSFHNGSDVDWVKFTLDYASNVTITTGSEVAGDTIIELYGPGSPNTLIQLNDNYTTGGYSQISRLGSSALAAGTYFVRVIENGQNNPLAKYTISVLATDTFEADDAAAAAKSISTDGIPQEHSLHVGTDADWVKFTLAVRSNVTILTEGVEGGDTVISLYSASNTTTALQTNNDYAAPAHFYSRIDRRGTTALPAGDYFVKVTGNIPNRTLARYTLSVNATDAFEDDNTAAQATPISTDGVPQEHSFHLRTDADWVSFTVAVPSNVVIQTDGIAGGDTVLALYSSENTTNRLAFNDDYNAPTHYYSRIDLSGSSALPAGRYLVRVTAYGAFRTLAKYSISVKATDVHENDDTFQNAKTISTDGTLHEHSFHAGSDVDWVRFTLGVESSVTIQTAGLAGGDTVIDLYSAANTTTPLQTNDNYAAGGTYSQIVRTGATVLPAGTYYVRVSEYRQNDRLDRYTISVTATDSFEADNDSSRAASIPTTGVPQAHSFHAGTDVDWVTFTLDVTSTVVIETDGDAGGDTSIQLYRSTDLQTPIASNGNNGVNNYSRISMSGTSALPAGTYFVRVSSENNSVLSRYTIRVAATDLFESDNSVQTATVIATDGVAQTHSLHNGADVDWYKFTLTTQSLVNLETDGIVGGDTVMNLYDGTGTRLLASNNDSLTSRYSRLSQTLGPGTYYVLISEFGMDAAIGRYTMRIWLS